MIIRVLWSLFSLVPAFGQISDSVSLSDHVASRYIHLGSTDKAKHIFGDITGIQITDQTPFYSMVEDTKSEIGTVFRIDLPTLGWRSNQGICERGHTSIEGRHRDAQQTVGTFEVYKSISLNQDTCNQNNHWIKLAPGIESPELGKLILSEIAKLHEAHRSNTLCSFFPDEEKCKASKSFFEKNTFYDVFSIEKISLETVDEVYRCSVNYGRFELSFGSLTIELQKADGILKAVVSGVNPQYSDFQQ